MYLWLEEMGLVVLPEVKDKEEFKAKFELLMRRMVTEQLSARLSYVAEIDIDKGVKYDGYSIHCV